MAHADFVAALVAAKWTAELAEKKVNELELAIKTKFPNGSPEFAEKTMHTAIMTLTKSKIEKLVGISCGFTKLQDSNDFDKKKALEIYAQDPLKAVQEHFVVTVDDKGKPTVEAGGRVIFQTNADGTPKVDKNGTPLPVPADHREYLDQETKKYKNGKYGKPLDENIQREAYFVMDVGGKKKFIRAFGNFQIKLGYECTIFGTLSDKGYVSIPKSGPGVVMTRMLDDIAYWNAINEVAQYDDLAKPLTEIAAMAKNKPFVSKGTVVRVNQAGAGAVLSINDDTLPEALACFTQSEELAEEVMALGAGNEVIVVAKTLDMDDKQNPGTKKRNASLLGFASNPESDAVAGAIGDLSDVMYS